MKLHHRYLTIIILSTLLLLTGCAVTIHRELKHQAFTVLYPNWDNYKLEKYDDKTFKAITTDNKNTCHVLVNAYTTDTLTIANILLETIDQTSTFTLINKDITRTKTTIEYKISKPRNEHVTDTIQQCGDYTYVIQYTCKESNYDKQTKSIQTGSHARGRALRRGGRRSVVPP